MEYAGYPTGRRFKGELAEARMCCSMEQELLPDYVGLALLSCLPAIPRDILTGMVSWPH